MTSFRYVQEADFPVISGAGASQAAAFLTDLDLLLSAHRSNDGAPRRLGQRSAASTTQSFSSDLNGVPFVTTGCDRLPFDPSIHLTPTTRAADAPTGLDADLTVPQSDAPDALATAHVKDVTVTLPAGTSISPSAAAGLEACTDAQIGLAPIARAVPAGVEARDRLRRDAAAGRAADGVGLRRLPAVRRPAVGQDVPPVLHWPRARLGRAAQARGRASRPTR